MSKNEIKDTEGWVKIFLALKDGTFFGLTGCTNKYLKELAKDIYRK